MTAEIDELGPHVNMTAEEALQLTLREEPTKVIILQECGCGCGGICVKSSGMTRAQAVFMYEQAKLEALGLDMRLGCAGPPNDTYENAPTADVVKFPG